MPRDLADVLHYFMPELGDPAVPGPDAQPGSPSRASSATATRVVQTAARRPASHRIALIPVGEREIVRASLIASLAHEISALGARATIVTPATENAQGLFPGHGNGSTDARVCTVGARSIGELHEAVVELVAHDEGAARAGELLLVRVPPAWLREPEPALELLQWVLLFSTSDPANLSNAHALAAAVLRANPGAEIGLTIHGAAGPREAEEAFSVFARSAERRLGISVSSYGLLLEDLDIYRSLVAGRTIGSSHPESPATQGVRNCAKLVFERARKAELD